VIIRLSGNIRWDSQNLARCFVLFVLQQGKRQRGNPGFPDKASSPLLAEVRISPRYVSVFRVMAIWVNPDKHRGLSACNKILRWLFGPGWPYMYFLCTSPKTSFCCIVGLNDTLVCLSVDPPFRRFPHLYTYIWELHMCIYGTDTSSITCR
jgi:hypothetical protein